MLGILYKDSPADLFRTMKETVLSVEPTEDDNVFQVTLDRNKYMETTEEPRRGDTSAASRHPEPRLSI